MAAPPPPPPEDVELGEWLSDYIVSVLKSPTWVLPLADFNDQRCHIFDNSEENKLEYTACHNDYKLLVGDLFATHLLEVSVTPEQFAAFCQRGLSQHAELHRALVEQLLSVDDFLTFKAMMTKHNADLDREAVYTLEDDDDAEACTSPGAALASNLVATSLATAGIVSEQNLEDDWYLYEDQLNKALEASKLEADAARQADQRCEEAELQQAIALSLQLEEERLRLLVQQEVSAAAEQAELAPAAPAAPPPPASDADIPPTAGFTSAPIAPIYRARPVTAAVDFNSTVASVASVASAAPAEETVVPRLVKMEALTPAESNPASGGFTSMPLVKPTPPQPPADEAASTAPTTAVEAAPAPPPAPAAPAQAPKPQLGLLKAPPNVEDMRKRLEDCRQRADRALAAPVSPTFRKPDRSETWTTPAAAPAPPPAGPQPPSAAPPPAAPSGPSEEERRQRAEHLKKQRDRLLQKRKQERDTQLTEFHRARNAAAAMADAPASADRGLSSEERKKAGRRLVAELTPGAVIASDTAPPIAEPEAAAELMRQALTLQLRQTLVHSIDVNANTLGSRLNQLEAMREL